MEKSIEIKNRFHLSSKTKQIIVDCIVYAFLFLWIYTAYEKAMDQPAFIKSLNQYTYIKEYATWFAWMIPAGEIAIAALLYFSKTRKLGLWASLVLMISFTTGLLIIISTTGLSRCGCGGFLSHLTASQHIWFNGIFIALALVALYLSSTSFRPKRRNLFALVASMCLISIPFPLYTIDCILYIRFIDEAPYQQENILRWNDHTISNIQMDFNKDTELKIPINAPTIPP